MQNKRFTCLGSGGLSFDIVTEREYPEGYIKQKTYSDHILLQEAGGACGNLMSFLSYYGWETYPIARIDTSLVAKQLIADLNRYGVDTRFIFQHIKNDTPVIQYRQDTDKEGKRHVINKNYREYDKNACHGIMGAICGDILGSYYEFHATKSVNFQLFPPQSRWTDDTAMTIALARWLMGERTSENLIHIMVEIGRKYPNAGFGGRFKRWLHSEDHPSMGSLGNGSAMRVSPVGLIADSLEEALSLAEISARVSHDHQEGIQGAQAVAAAIYLTRTGSSKQDIKEYISRTFGYDLNRTCDEIRPTYKFESGCAKSVPEAIICWLESDTYEETVRKAISLGGDADTMACIAGSIAAATPSMGVSDFILQRGYRYLEKEFAETVWAFDNACNNK